MVTNTMKSKLIIGAFILILLSIMNTYSRALRHINMKDVKQKHQQKLIEQKIQEEKKKEEKKYIDSIMEEKKYDWRKKLNEQMTTSDMFFATLPATGDEIIATQSDETLSGNSVEGYYGLSSDRLYKIPDNVDTMVFTVSAGVGQLELYTPRRVLGPFGSGRHTIQIKPSDKQFAWAVTNGEATTGFGTWRISDIGFQRRSPMNVFVPLDSPEATSFIRTGSGDLTPEEKQKKIKEMLEASDEYIRQMYGDEFPGTGAVPPGESGTTPGVQTIDYGNDLTPLSSNPYGTEVGQVAGTYDLIKSGQVPYMKPEKAKQILNDPKYQPLWDDDPDALKAVQRLVKGA